MDVKEAIRQRRSVGKLKQDPIAHELIEEILEAAVWAPNHANTEPWRFWVMSGEGRKLLGRGYAEVAVAEAQQASAAAGKSLTTEEEEQLNSASHKKAFRAPLIIAVAVSPSEQRVVPEIEEFAAVHCAVQNMMLTAHALGLGTIWRTGEPTYHPKMKANFGLSGREEMVGFVYIGYPEAVPTKATRVPFATKTQWVTE
ncbi:nitroreductase family protein [Paenibacillus roseipurpureus]|uniref:Putative NAD(P)H nitroreductase n=1 Tax=Paenibacillus roseopurpureus TaxID=2918901 RepID=A0AA96LUJ2_9BACL|nr:nitroreductase [Paenibacillus sp. MBLB1832]WNR44905.1 nitroreductase [Paenibacillus sp. MBLB1832]